MTTPPEKPQDAGALTVGTRLRAGSTRRKLREIREGIERPEIWNRTLDMVVDIIEREDPYADQIFEGPLSHLASKLMGTRITRDEAEQILQAGVGVSIFATSLQTHDRRAALKAVEMLAGMSGKPISNHPAPLELPPDELSPHDRAEQLNALERLRGAAAVRKARIDAIDAEDGDVLDVTANTGPTGADEQEDEVAVTVYPEGAKTPSEAIKKRESSLKRKRKRKRKEDETGSTL